MEEDWRIDEAAEDDAEVSHVLAFDEGLAHDREDLVAEAVTFLETLPGVTAVEHVEREYVEIAAHDVSTSHLTEALRVWWEAAKGEKRPWMVAVDRAAGMVAELTAAHGYRRDGWQLTRTPDAGLSHTIILDHAFGRGPGEDLLTVAGQVRFTQPRAQAFTIMRWTGAIEAGADLAGAITGHVLPMLEPLSTLDAALEQWAQGRSILEGGRWPRTSPESLFYTQVLVTRGRLDEAGQVFQQEFERSQPQQRQHLLNLAEEYGVSRPVTAAASPLLSLDEEATLAAWQANTTAMVDQLRDLTGLRLDGSRGSLDKLWAWLRGNRDRLQTTFADATPALDIPYYGPLTGSDIMSGRLPFEPWYRMTVELVTAYLGQVVMKQAPGTQWGVDGDGALAMARGGGTGLLWRVAGILHEVFGAPPDRFRPHQLRGLGDDMVRWVKDSRYPLRTIVLGRP